MKFKDYVKAGIGLSIGVEVGKVLALTCFNVITEKFYNSDTLMEYAKENNADMYERFKKYRTKGEDESD